MIQTPVRQPTELPHVIQDASNRQVAVCRDAETAAEIVGLINGAGRGIKALEWEERTDPFGERYWLAQTAVGCFQLGQQRTDRRWWTQGPIGKGFSIVFDDGSLEAAKDACWQDYLARLAPIFEGAKET